MTTASALFCRANRLEIVELDPAARGAWSRDGRKLDRLHRYWLNRAVDAFAASEIATQTIGRPENHEANRFAYINAMRSQLRLVEVYGADTTVTTDSGESVDLFQALLSLELTSAFFNTDYLAPFALHLAETGHCLEALGRLAINGLVEGFPEPLPADLVRPHGEDRQDYRLDRERRPPEGQSPHGRRDTRFLDKRLGLVGAPAARRCART